MFVRILWMLRIKTVICHLKELIQMKLTDTEMNINMRNVSPTFVICATLPSLAWVISKTHLTGLVDCGTCN